MRQFESSESENDRANFGGLWVRVHLRPHRVSRKACGYVQHSRVCIQKHIENRSVSLSYISPQKSVGGLLLDDYTVNYGYELALNRSSTERLPATFGV